MKMRRYTMPKVYNHTYIRLIVLIALACVYCCSIFRPHKICYEKEYRILVQIKDEEDKPVENATVKMIEGMPTVTRKIERKSIIYETHQDGSISIQPIYCFPFHLEVSHGEAYIPQTIKISHHLFPGNRRSTEVFVILPRRKTVIIGIVLDRDTSKPIPVTTIKVSPLGIIETTDKNGDYRIDSSQFYEGSIYTVSAEKSGKYEKYSQQVTIDNYWGENKVPDIRLKALPQDDVEVMVGDSIEVRPPTGVIRIGD